MKRPGWRKRTRWRQAFAWACDRFPSVGKPRLIITPDHRMEKDSDGDPIDGSYNPNNGILRLRAGLRWGEGLAVLWHELSHAMNRSRCKLPEPDDHDMVHGANEWMIQHSWHYGGGHVEADNYEVDKR